VGALCSGRAVTCSARLKLFEGITYGCKRLDATEEGSGLVHWVIVNLAAPGIELYVTPLDPRAIARGWQYRLRRIGDVIGKERLAVAVRGGLGCLNSFSASISGASAAVRLPSGVAAG
jgi:hypothetical protein